MRISRISTSTNADSSSVPSIPSKTLIASAEKPAPPVTLTSRPPPLLSIRLRTASTGSMIVSASPSLVMFATTSAASRLGEYVGLPNADVARSSPFSTLRLSTLRSRAMTRRSAAVRPPSRR